MRLFPCCHDGTQLVSHGPLRRGRERSGTRCSPNTEASPRCSRSSGRNRGSPSGCHTLRTSSEVGSGRAGRRQLCSRSRSTNRTQTRGLRRGSRSPGRNDLAFQRDVAIAARYSDVTSSAILRPQTTSRATHQPNLLEGKWAVGVCYLFRSGRSDRHGTHGLCAGDVWYLQAQRRRLTVQFRRLLLLCRLLSGSGVQIERLVSGYRRLCARRERALWEYDTNTTTKEGSSACCHEHLLAVPVGDIGGQYLPVLRGQVVVHLGVEQHRLKEGLRHFRTGFREASGNTRGQTTADHTLGCVLSCGLNDRAQQSAFDTERVEVGVSQCATEDAHLNQWIAQVLLVADSRIVHASKVHREVSPSCASSRCACHTLSSHTGTRSQ